MYCVVEDFLRSKNTYGSLRQVCSGNKYLLTDSTTATSNFIDLENVCIMMEPVGHILGLLAALAQMVECPPLGLQGRGPIPCGVVNFHLKIFNLDARRSGNVHFLVAR